MRTPQGELRCADIAGWLAPDATVHILLSGPSVGRIEAPQRIADAPTITVNGSFRVLRNVGSVSALYLVSDVGFVRRQWQTFREGADSALALALDHRVLYEVMRRDPALVQRRTVYLFDNLLRPYGRSSHWWKTPPNPAVWQRAPEVAFSSDAAFGYHPSCSVAYLALQIAATQRPAGVTLFGLDLGGGRYYAESQPERSMLQQDLQPILAHLAFAARCLSESGIRQINASLDSALPASVMPQADPNAYLTKFIGRAGTPPA